MKYSKGLIASTSLLALSLTLLQFIAAPSPADARGGGGGGGGFRGGGFGGGGFGGRDFGGRGDFGRGGFGDGAWGNSGFAGNMDRNAADEDRPRASEGDLRASANQDYHFPNLPTDGGLGRAAGQGIGGSRITSNVSSAGMAARGAAVRNAFNHNDLFNRDFFNRFDRAWYPGWGGDWGWGYTGWGDLCSFWGDSDDSEPVEYDYGNNITYQGDQVYYGNQPFESADDYYTQAQTLALSAPPSVPPLASSKATNAGSKTGTKAGASVKISEKQSDWKPLGVFALTQGDQTDSNSIFQLAVNKKGIIRGNYYNPLTQEEQAVQGKFDKKSKRVAWTIGSNKNTVYDTGIANLLAKQSSLLIHLNKSKTQQWNIIRLQQNKSS